MHKINDLGKTDQAAGEAPISSGASGLSSASEGSRASDAERRSRRAVEAEASSFSNGTPLHWTDANTPIWALVSGFPSPIRERRLLCMLQAYIDDSGKGDPPVHLLAGFVASAESWAAFSDEWRSVLDLYPRIEYFKMREAAACVDQFNGWKDEIRDERVNQLIAVINKYAKVQIYSVVAQAIYKEIFSFGVPKELRNPFNLTFWGIIVLMMKYQHLHNTYPEKVDFIFDTQIIPNGIRDRWDYFEAHMSPEASKIIGSRPIERDDKDVLPLQAADLLAWKIRRGFYDKYHKQPDSWKWDSFNRIEAITEGWDRNRLLEMYRRIPKEWLQNRVITL